MKEKDAKFEILLNVLSENLVQNELLDIINILKKDHKWTFEDQQFQEYFNNLTISNLLINDKS